MGKIIAFPIKITKDQDSQINEAISGKIGLIHKIKCFDCSKFYHLELLVSKSQYTKSYNIRFTFLTEKDRNDHYTYLLKVLKFLDEEKDL